MLFHHRLAWVSIAPFGRPVVPEVYMITRHLVAVDRVDEVVGERRAVAGDVGEGDPAGRVAVGGDVVAARQLVADAVEHRAVGLVGHDRVDAGVVDDVAELGAGEAEVQRHEDGAEARRREQHLEERRLVEAEERRPGRRG